MNGEIAKYVDKHGIFPSDQEIAREELKVRTMFQKMGGNRYFEIEKQMLKKYAPYETEVFITDESYNKAVMSNQLNSLLQTYARIPGVNIDVDMIFKEILDLMGLGGARFLKTPQPTPAPTGMANQLNQGQANPAPTNPTATPDMTQMTAGANTLEQAGNNQSVQ